MTLLKRIAGYTLAALATPLVMATFMGWEFWSQQLASASGVKVSPWYTGGEVARTVAHGSYRTLIHRPVFDGLLWEAEEGFVQIQWTPLAALPAAIREAVDYDGDGRDDFQVELDTMQAQARLTGVSPAAVSLEGAYKLKDAWAVRVNLRNLKR
jgi:hypothetical protein